ncbi:hypothetical protein K461DRAFT_318501 [Myriangium duriaei CBS 260.36]|uniref:Btz domain-containing protein n=1 Tax=Myriangium duriaei CBS 260.36 TaxID=1168546 RepID=A0A9P4MQQ7_9PEZI|nr:hypothetical protein K461DRAFT_318501 [Myriangium duriaei CBS 260.36]
MAVGRKSKEMIGRRRRTAGDSDDEEESVLVGDDSQSETSVITSGEGEDDAHEKHGQDESSSQFDQVTAQSLPNGASQISTATPSTDRPEDYQNPIGLTKAGKGSSFAATPDTQVMLNGMEEAQSTNEDQAIDYNDLPTREDSKAPVKADTPAERRRREQEQYRQKRDADPTFIPSRGNFFMHDARASDQRGYMGPSRGRGRGRGFVGGPFSPANVAQGQSSRVADSIWAHDLHDAINEPEQRSLAQPNASQRPLPIHQNPATAARAAPAPDYRPCSFSTSKLLGKVQIRVLLPNMNKPIPFPGIPVKQHTRLPDHRPPLRRDKPVRISLPDRAPSYIFPSQERSFIFIPRAMRPNQQALGRNRLGPSSRRTSAYGGSIYSPSIALSRRSSIAREVGREFMFSPAGSVAARHISSGRPVVRLPQGASQPPSIASPVGSVAAHMPGGFPLPQTPAIEHYRETATMHQPRPQKAISVSGIDSPAALSLHAPRQQDQQPFENQLPHHMAEGSFGSSVNPDVLQPSYYAYPGQTGTPLSHIPERAIHAQPFQPPSQGYGQAYYGQYSQPGFYYQPVPMFVPQGTPRTVAAQPAGGEQEAARGQSGMMAHESNGMVFYIDPSQMQSYPQQGGYSGQESYMPAAGPNYAMPGMGGMMNPSAEGGWYYPPVATGAVYYPQQ